MGPLSLCYQLPALASAPQQWTAWQPSFVGRVGKGHEKGLQQGKDEVGEFSLRVSVCLLSPEPPGLLCLGCFVRMGLKHTEAALISPVNGLTLLPGLLGLCWAQLGSWLFSSSSSGSLCPTLPHPARPQSHPSIWPSCLLASPLPPPEL